MSVPKVFKVQLGETIQSPAIARCDVASGTKGRAILLTDSFIACAIAFTPEPHKGAFFVDQEDCLRLGLNPTVFYIGLIARMNTDMRGNPTDDSFRIEYVRLREQQYDKFASTLLEMPNAQTVLLSLNDKAGRSYSYVELTPSTREVNQGVVDAIKEKIAMFDVDQLFNLVVNNLARPIEEYEKLLNGDAAVATPTFQLQQQISQPVQQRPRPIAAPKPSQDPPQVEDADFEGEPMEGVDFGNEDPDEFGQ